MLKKILYFSIVATILACSSSTEHSEPQNYSLTSVISAVEKAMSMGIQKRSPNSREFYSRPFLVIQSKIAQKAGVHERGLAKVIVLGEARPYTLEVEVSIQRSKIKKDKKDLYDEDYVFDRYDKRLAKELLMNIISVLDKRERNKNVVDDFKSF